MRPISPVALVPLSIIWFGIGDMSRYFIIFYGVVIIMIMNTAAGVSATPNIRLNAARCLGASRQQIFRRIIIPSAVPYILTGMRVSLGFAFMGIVAAEMIAAQSGIGYLIMQSRMLLRTDIMFVGLVTLGVLGAVIDGVFQARNRSDDEALHGIPGQHIETAVNYLNSCCTINRLGGDTMYKTWTLPSRERLQTLGVCSGSSRQSHWPCAIANAADPKIRIFSGTDEHWVPLQVAKTKGYFAAQGLDAEVTVFTTGAAATEAFRAGRGDFISAGDFPSAAMWKSGNVIGLAPMSSDTEIFGIVGKKDINSPQRSAWPQSCDRAGIYRRVSALSVSRFRRSFTVGSQHRWPRSARNGHFAWCAEISTLLPGLRLSPRARSIQAKTSN